MASKVFFFFSPPSEKMFARDSKHAKWKTKIGFGFDELFSLIFPSTGCCCFFARSLIWYFYNAYAAAGALLLGMNDYVAYIFYAILHTHLLLGC